ncbi:MAG: DUF2807 domain-containing protein [Flavobacteriales bacterium]|nr:DUF2807 domain-containing protein [Flavobacteriales bacterium]
MKKPTFCLFVTILFFFSCSKDNEKEVRILNNLGVFHEVTLNSAFEVILIQDSINFIEIVTVESLKKDIEVKLVNEVLSIVNNKKFKWTNPENNIPTLYIHCAEFKKINANESCNFTTPTPITSKEFGIVLKDKANYADLQINCDVFFYWNNFPTGGKLTLSGTTKELKIWNTAIMSVDAKNLVAEYALIENESKGICEVNVTNKLEYKITGKGDIHLYGNPPEIIQNEVSSTGKLIQF